MKKQKTLYRIYRYEGKMLRAKRDIPFDIQLSSRLMLDQLCYNWNKKQLEQKIDAALVAGNKKKLKELSKLYREYCLE